MTDQTIQAVIYCRVSSKSQEQDGHGLQSQEARCRQHAAMKGYEVAAVFPDTITGGGDYLQRPGMKALLSFIDAQPDQNFVVVFDDLKRASRDTRSYLNLRDAFRDRGVGMDCLNMKLGDTPEDEFIETIMAAQGALERKQNGRQVAQKMKARMEAGYWIHNPPVGYRYETLKGHGKVLVPHEPLASMVQDAFEGYVSGRFGSQAEVRRFFETFPDFPRNRKGEIPQQRVTDIFTNPIYTGHICSENYGLHWLKGHHQALITVETFEAVQENRQSITKTAKRDNIGDDFVLRGMVTCAGCGVPLRSSYSKGRSKTYPYYLCQTKSCGHYGKSMARDSVEADIGALIKTLEPTRKLITLAKAMFRKAWDQRTTQAKEIIQTGQKQLKDVEKQIDTLLTRIVESTNATVIRTYEDKIADLEKHKARLADQLANQADPGGTFEEKLEPVLTFLANPYRLWETGNVTLRRTVLKLAFADRIPYERNKGPRTVPHGLPFKALSGVKNEGVCFGAGEGTRTPTPKAPEPKSGASTSSATPALMRGLTKLALRCERENAAFSMKFIHTSEDTKSSQMRASNVKGHDHHRKETPMPVYTVTAPKKTAQWNLTEAPPDDPKKRPVIVTDQPPNAYKIQPGQWQNFVLSKLGTQGLQTALNTPDAAAFAMVWLSPDKQSNAIGAMISMPHGADAGQVPWYKMVSGMGSSGTQYGLLVTTLGEDDHADFTMAAAENANIAAENLWVYNAQSNDFTFAIDLTGNVGQLT